MNYIHSSSPVRIVRSFVSCIPVHNTHTQHKIMLFHSLPPQWHYLLLITLVDHHVRVDYPRTVRASTHWRLVVCALDVRERIKMSTLAGGQIVCWVIIRCKLEKDLASYFSVPLVTAHKYAGLGQGHSTSVIQPHSNTKKMKGTTFYPT